jgi:hypothetical protein
MLFQSQPPVAVYPLFLLMPLTHALAELPTYFCPSPCGTVSSSTGAHFLLDATLPYFVLPAE